jgi:hypothetical protein
MKRLIGFSSGRATINCDTILDHFIFSVLYSGSCILLSIPFSCGVLSSALSQYLSSSVIPCSILFLSCTGSVLVLVPYCTGLSGPGRRISPQPFSNPPTVALGVPSRGHSIEQFIFPAVMQTSFSLLREQRFT